MRKIFCAVMSDIKTRGKRPSWCSGGSGTGLEGVIAKKKDSLYFKGKRTKSWLKMKHLIDYDFVVCWYVDKGNHMTSIVLGQYREKT